MKDKKNNRVSYVFLSFYKFYVNMTERQILNCLKITLKEKKNKK